MNSTARTIARRYQATILRRELPRTDVIFSDGGVLTTGDLRRLLEPQFGILINMRMRPSLIGAPNTIAWEALDEDAEIVSGEVGLPPISWTGRMRQDVTQSDVHEEQEAST